MKSWNALLLLLALLPACRSTTTASRTPHVTPDFDARPVVEAVAEESVKPGINDNFLGDDVDVESYVDRFEGESREIAVHRDDIVRALELRSGLRVADIGAGTGLFLEPFATAVGPTGRVYAVDISETFIEHLGERAKAGGWSHVEPVLCSERSCELPAASVELAFVCDTYHHFEYPRSTLASLFRALRPDGRLVVIDFERVPGVTRPWLLDHVRAGKEVFRAEIEAAGFVLEDELTIPGLEENYVLCFRRP